MKEKMIECVRSNKWKEFSGNSPYENKQLEDFINYYFKSYRPERSKREDSITYLDDLDKGDVYQLIKAFGEIERKCREMRCSEHYGNIVT